ncbi:MAG: choice-of-anchor J domain-containing protein [Ferruginibacter sp.]
MRLIIQRLVLSFTLFTILLPVVKSQTITIGTGTGATTSQPIGTFYSYSASEMIYLSSEIGNTVNITGIAFDKASGASTENVNNVSIYMKKTSASNYGTGVTKFTTSTEGYTKVWEGSFPNQGNGWQGVTLSTPFKYDDLTKNLAILIVNNSGAAIASGRPQYRYTTTSPNKQNGNFGDLSNTVPWSASSQLTPVWERANVRFNTSAITGCINPSSLSAKDITSTTATITWKGDAANTPAGYDWEIRVNGEGGSGYFGLVKYGNTTGSTEFASVSELTGGSAYKLYVRAKCSNGNTSVWTGPYDFSTACDVMNLPFVEGFNSNIRPSCWTQNFVAGPLNVDFTYPGTGSYPYATVISFEGSNMVSFSASTIEAGTQMRLVSPPIATSGVNSIDVEFEWYQINVLENYPDKMNLQYSLDGTNWMEVPNSTMSRSAADGEGWKHKTVTLPAAAANQPKVYVGFLFTSASGFNCHLDDIRIKATGVSCAAPPTVNIGNISSTGVTISWTAPPVAPANGYEWKIVDINAGPGGEAIQTGKTNNLSAVVTGLSTSSKSYSVFVRSICETANSTWSNAATFSTLCSAFPLPFKEEFTGQASVFPPTCWTRSDNNFVRGSDAGAFGVGTGAAIFNNFVSPFGNYDLVLPVTEPTTDGYHLLFNHAYAPYALGDYKDGLIISYSTDGGLTYNILSGFTGNLLQSLITAPATSDAFIPDSYQWGIKSIPLPPGTNRIKFTVSNGGGNNLFIDNVQIKIPDTRISISPNPTTGIAIIRGIDMENATFVLRDILGRTLMTVKNRSVINISGLPAAVYVATIYMPGGKYTQKIVKLK